MTFVHCFNGVARAGFLSRFLLMMTVLMAGFSAHASDESGRSFAPSDNVPSEVLEANRTAVKNGKRVLVIMGANWCHDSRALASRVEQEPLKSIIDDHFETVFVDVGYLEISPDVVEGFGIPVYYATPTVLIFDPVSGQMVNADNRHQWGSADTISMEDSVAYFESMVNAEPESSQDHRSISPELQVLYDEIDDFQHDQAVRLYRAYDVIGPMLRAMKESEAPADFEERWYEVRGFRMQVPADVEALRFEAESRVFEGQSDIELSYPEYPGFSWEAESGG